MDPFAIPFACKSSPSYAMLERRQLDGDTSCTQHEVDKPEERTGWKRGDAYQVDGGEYLPAELGAMRAKSLFDARSS